MWLIHALDLHGRVVNSDGVVVERVRFVGNAQDLYALYGTSGMLVYKTNQLEKVGAYLRHGCLSGDDWRPTPYRLRFDWLSQDARAAITYRGGRFYRDAQMRPHLDWPGDVHVFYGRNAAYGQIHAAGRKLMFWRQGERTMLDVLDEARWAEIDVAAQWVEWGKAA